MKRVDLIRVFTKLGCDFVRHGGRHDWYRNPNTGVAQPVPRHREIKEGLARHIIRMLSNPTPEEPPQETDSDSEESDNQK